MRGVWLGQVGRERSKAQMREPDLEHTFFTVLSRAQSSVSWPQVPVSRDVTGHTGAGIQEPYVAKGGNL